MTNNTVSGFSASLTDEINFICHDRYMKILLFIVPVFLLTFVSAMFSSGVPEKIPVALVDYDHSSLSREIIRNIDASKSIELTEIPENVAQAQRLMKSMKIYAFIEIPRGASGSTIRQDDNKVIIRYNGQFRSTGNAAFIGLQAAVNDAFSSLNNRKSLGAGHKGAGSSVPNIQVVSISNPQNSYERFLTPIAIPVLLSIVLSSAVICAIGRFFEEGKLCAGWMKKSRICLSIQIVSRCLPYITIIFLWNLLFNVWQTAGRGWPILGNSWLLILAIFMLCLLTASVAIMFISITRNILTALSISTVYTSAALTYSDGTLSILNANGWAKFWSNFQPFTHYYRIQLEQVNLGSDITTSLYQFGILSLYIIIPLTVSFMLLGKHKYKQQPATFQENVKFDGIKQSVISTLTSIKKSQPIFSTAIMSLILYSIFYPSAYKAQINLKLPVAVVDFDQSSLSRNLIDNLQTTREIDVTRVDSSLSEALNLLRNRKVSAVITIDNDFKNNLIRGGDAGIDVHLSGGYMAVAADLRVAVINAISATTDVNRLTPKTTDHIISLPLYNPTLGYESFIMPLVFIIILQQTLIFAGSMLIALRNSVGLTNINVSQFIGTFLGLFIVGFSGAIFVFGWVYYLQGYPNEGNMFLQLWLIVLFSAAVSSMSMLIGSFLDNINRPMQILSATSMVIFYASGASFPTFNMPGWVVKTMEIFPSSTMISGFTMLNSQGAGIYELMPVIIKISLLAIILFLLAMYRLVWRKSKAA
ncbi:TPA: ABC transporter permease [Morganella morganii]|nr:ABC transporter permease [Morganella morganii]MCU6225160.1 ABC transporter permease [Morganella morganii]MCU6231929.1 ABC transporter permease [Morganella morganii]HAT1514357.1 ABC transporter permease [Morganella morganii]